MPGHGKKKRSRSRSREDHRHKRKPEDKFDDIQKQLDNLKDAIETLVHVQKEQKPPNQAAEMQIGKQSSTRANSLNKEALLG